MRGKKGMQLTKDLQEQKQKPAKKNKKNKFFFFFFIISGAYLEYSNSYLSTRFVPYVK